MKKLTALCNFFDPSVFNSCVVLYVSFSTESITTMVLIAWLEAGTERYILASDSWLLFDYEG